MAHFLSIWRYRAWNRYWKEFPLRQGWKIQRFGHVCTTKKKVHLVRPFPEIQKLCTTLHTLSESFYLQDITIYCPSGNYHWIHSKIFKSLLLFCRVTNIRPGIRFPEVFQQNRCYRKCSCTIFHAPQKMFGARMVQDTNVHQIFSIVDLILLQVT